MKTYQWLFASVFLFTTYAAHAQTPEEKGLEIAREVDNRDIGWGDSTVDVKMVLRNRQGEESVRAIRSKVLEVQGDGDKGLTIFDEPADVKGTAFLSFSHSTVPDDQWLYLPALKRVKRIASANKSGPFMGSEFAFEDLASFEVDKYKYKYLRDEKLDGIDSFVVENYPQYENSGYTRQIVWIDKQRYIPLKIEFYDRKNSLLKTLNFKDYKQFLGKYWRALGQVMENQQNGKTTVLTFHDYKMHVGLNERDFDSNSLNRVR